MNLDPFIIKRIFLSTTSNDRSFGCPVIYTDTIHNAVLFIDTSTMLDTTKIILYLG